MHLNIQMHKDILLYRFKQGSKDFNDDAKFGRQRLSSLNSLLIKLCTSIPQK